MSEQDPNKKSLFNRFTTALSKTRSQIGQGIGSLLIGKKEINEELLDELQTQLLTSDVGVVATERLMRMLHRRVNRKRAKDGDAILEVLQTEMKGTLKNIVKPLQLTTQQPFVILVVGANGVGKTTTIGKLAHYLQNQGHSVMLAAGDTYRAAAIDQLKTWGQRTSSAVVAQQPGSDSASVIFDAIQSAAARGIDVVIADTAGRLQNKEGLMSELAKIRRVIQKHDPDAPHETLLILDAGVGQNAISQVREFKETADVSGLVVTKLDGSARAGVIIGLATEHPLPLYFVGLGEQQDDLQPFDPDAYVNGLFAN